MGFNLRNRSLLALKDLAPDAIRFLRDLATELKRSKAVGNELPRLKGKNIALIFEKPSTRTRCALEVAVHDRGGHVTCLDAGSSQLGHKESLKDTARVLGRHCDGIEYRGFHRSVVEELARFAKVPVWNGPTDEAHPAQMRELARRTGARITLETAPLDQLLPYPVTTALMHATVKPRTRFMRCLPAFPGLDTEVGRGVHPQYGLSELEATGHRAVIGSLEPIEDLIAGTAGGADAP